jgi:hypothetical protein
MGYEAARWMQLAQDRVQWWALILAVLNLPVLLPEIQLNVKERVCTFVCNNGVWKGRKEKRSKTAVTQFVTAFQKFLMRSASFCFHSLPFSH